ncbi:MAG: type II toxin-antitoxin system RelE/ParE family toxin [Candidatus Sumerlaeia bacterium]
MAKYEIRIRKSVAKDLEPIPRRDVQKILAAIKSLADDPRPPQAIKLSGAEKYRLRCGVYRILYENDGQTLNTKVVNTVKQHQVQY